MNFLKTHLVFIVWILTATLWTTLLMLGWPWPFEAWILQGITGFITFVMLLVHGQPYLSEGAENESS